LFVRSVHDEMLPPKLIHNIFGQSASGEKEGKVASPWSKPEYVVWVSSQRQDRKRNPSHQKLLQQNG
jgi:hypothetical protein